MRQSQTSQNKKPNHHYRSEKLPDKAGSELLNHENGNQNRDGDRNNRSIRIINFKTFNADITVSEGVITPSAIRAAAPTIAIRYNQPFLRFLPEKKVQEYLLPLCYLL
jgi:hypothetical protein